MKIVCTNNQYSILPEYLQQVYISNDGRDLNPRLEDITIAKTYIVYATAALNGYPGYFICDNYREYPIWHPSDFFSIVDSRLSRYWIVSIKKDDKTTTRLFLSFPEWANEQYYYNNLIEGEAREMDLFRKYKQLMNLEFPDSAITQAASIGDQEWLICPSCLDAWKNSNCDDALVMCPICHQTFCNPRYQNKFPRINGLISQSS